MQIPAQRPRPALPLERYTFLGDVSGLTRHLERRAREGLRACLVLRVAPEAWDVVLSAA
jgi:hypothetical protein